MGWLWASSSPAKSPLPAQDRPTPNAGGPAPGTAPTEPVDPEIQKFFDLFQSDSASARPSESAPTSSPRHEPPSPSSSSASDSSTLSWRALKTSPKTQPPPSAPLRDALAESLLPTEMSCRQAFDLAWSCNSIGGQFNSVYRYGSMGSCSELWDDFWFCMRTKSYTGELKESMVRAHYRNKEQAKYGPGKPSSQDVWQSREQKMQPGAAFSEPMDVPLAGDDERRRIGDGKEKAGRARFGL